MDSVLPVVNVLLLVDQVLPGVLNVFPARGSFPGGQSASSRGCVLNTADSGLLTVSLSALSGSAFLSLKSIHISV